MICTIAPCARGQRQFFDISKVTENAFFFNTTRKSSRASAQQILRKIGRQRIVSNDEKFDPRLLQDP